MTQRKPSDKIIEAKLDEVESLYSTGSDEQYYIVGAVEGFEKGAKWAREYDPWFYVEDGELPYDSSQLGEDKMLMTDEVLVIFHSGKKYVLQYQANGKDYGEDLWRDPKTGDSYDKYSVKCWQYIEKPQK